MMKALSYLLVILAANAVLMPLGGVLHMLVGALFVVPGIGRLLAFVNNHVFKFAVLTKFIAWCISASGAVGGFLIVQMWLGPPQTWLHWLAITIAAGTIVASLSYRIFMFEFYDVTGNLKFMTRLPRKFLNQLASLDDEVLVMMARRNFVDMNFIPILQLLAAFGLLLFAMSNIGIMKSEPPKPALIDCLAAAYSVGALSTEAAVKFSGPWWLMLRLFIGVVLLVWAVVFIGLAIDELPKYEKARQALGLNPTAEGKEEESIG